jgi:DHA2 family multidrug resistance protein-like MFS transporter
VAVLGSLAASRYSTSISRALDTLPAEARGSARTSLGGALEAANKLDETAGRTVRLAAQHAFVNGVHFAVTIAACLAVAAAMVVLRFLPHEATHETATDSAEHMAELGVGGVPPLFDRGAG